MRLACTEQCELPFILNLPEGTYEVKVEGSAVSLDIIHEHVALNLAGGMFAVDHPSRLRTRFGEDFDRAHKQQLRTMIRHVTIKDVNEIDLPQVPDDKVMEAMQAGIIGESPMNYAGRTDELKAEAQRRLDAMSSEDRDAFRRKESLRIAGSDLADAERFLKALNVLIRLYMERFKDFFVEEVTLHQLAAQSPLRGVFVHITCDDMLVHNYGHVGKMPPMMHRPWANHPPLLIDQFKVNLKNGTPPDSSTLLEVRAKAFLERGAYRSAIIESSAALDLSVTRKLRHGYGKQGKSPTEIDDILKGVIDFKERANKLMNQATGKRVFDLDKLLYDRVLDHRRKYRHGIAHSDVEPPKSEAEQVVHDFERLKNLIEGIPA